MPAEKTGLAPRSRRRLGEGGSEARSSDGRERSRENEAPLLIIAGTSRFPRVRHLLIVETKGRPAILQLGRGDWLQSGPK